MPGLMILGLLAGAGATPPTYDLVVPGPNVRFGRDLPIPTRDRARLRVAGGDVVFTLLAGGWVAQRSDPNTAWVRTVTLDAPADAAYAGVADVDGDGRDEFLLDEGGTLAGFDATGARVWSTPLLNPADIRRVADLDADGVPEVVTYDDFEVTVRTLDGFFLGRRPTTRYGLEIAQIDGDPQLEVLGIGTVYEGATLEVDGSRDIPNSRVVDACDVDGDGDDELFLFGIDLRIWDAGRVLWRATPRNVESFAFGDLDGSGSCEVVVKRTVGVTIVGAASARPLGRVDFDEPCGQILPADFDGDGIDEIVCGSTTRWVDVDAGRFVDLSPLPEVSAFQLADLDGDGIEELVSGNLGDLYVLDTNGVILSRQPLSTFSPSFRAVGDLDGDGLAELVTTDAGVELFRWTPGTGFVFDSALPSTRRNLNAPRVGDVDGDGIGEIVYVDITEIKALDVFSGGSTVLANGSSFELVDLAGDGTPEVFYGNAGASGAVDPITGNGLGFGWTDARVVHRTGADAIARRALTGTISVMELNGTYLANTYVDVPHLGDDYAVAAGRIWYPGPDGLIGLSVVDDSSWLLPGVHSFDDVFEVHGTLVVSGDVTSFWTLPTVP